MEKINLKNLTLIQMRDWIKAQGWPAFRAQQIFAWLYRTGISEFSQMTDISKEVRAKLAQIATISRLTPAMEERSEDGSVKYGFRLADGAIIESVLIPEGDRLTVTDHGVMHRKSDNHGISGHRVPQVAAHPEGISFARADKLPSSAISGMAMRTFVREPDRSPQDVVPCDRLRLTLCVSSQVGCAMGCNFCLTGTMGFVRNLSAAEIVGQVQAITEIVQAQGRNRINNLVFMGMGEPLANFDNLIDALNILMEQTGLDFSSRRITVSTCGIIPKLKALGEAVTVNLAISLHAADDETRSQLMPINQTYPVDELLAACRAYPLPSRRKVMIEYIMIKDLNDSVRHARLLIKKLHKLRCKVNLLPYNENKTFPYQSPDRERVELFQQTLRDSGITSLIRESRGGDISAACGQLAAEADEED